MKTALQIDFTFDQILSLVKQLPQQQKLELSKELEKEVVDAKLTRLLKTFNSENLSMDTIDAEVEKVRQEIYEKQQRQGNF